MGVQASEMGVLNEYFFIASPVRTALHCTHTTCRPHQDVVQQKQQVAVGSGYAFDAGFGLSRSQP